MESQRLILSFSLQNPSIWSHRDSSYHSHCKTRQCRVTDNLLTNEGHVQKEKKSARGPFWNKPKEKPLTGLCSLFNLKNGPRADFFLFIFEHGDVDDQWRDIFVHDFCTRIVSFFTNGVPMSAVVSYTCLPWTGLFFIFKQNVPSTEPIPSPDGSEIQCGNYLSLFSRCQKKKNQATPLSAVLYTVKPNSY